MKVIDLNCDMGESFGNYKLGLDEEVIKHISSANIACGFHAGDPMVMEKTVHLAKEHRVAPGAHPGFPDLMGFGRRTLEATRHEMTNYIIYQVGALMAFCKACGLKLQHVKTHGKLYSNAWEDEIPAMATAEAIARLDPSMFYLIMGGRKGEIAYKAGKEMGLKMARETYPDRAYLPDGSLVPRKQPGAVIKDPDLVTARAVRMASEKKVVAIDGTVIDLQVDTICVHGDNPSAVEIVKKIKDALKREDIEIKPIGTFL
jgi:5-oxoprolinase (ATP-hydrolysing) subunit A